MTKTTMYRYLGVNGTIDSPVLLEGIYHVTTVLLKADDGKVLTKDGMNYVYSVRVPEAEVNEWREVKDKSK